MGSRQSQPYIVPEEDAGHASDNELIDLNGQEQHNGVGPTNGTVRPQRNVNPYTLYFGAAQPYFFNDFDEGIGYDQDTTEEEGQQRTPGSSKVSCTVTVKSPMNLNKDSLVLVPRKDEAGVYSLQFVLDVTSACSVRVFWCADENNLPTNAVSSYTFNRGVGHHFCEDTCILDVNKFDEEQLMHNGTSSTYPLIVVLSVTDSDLLSDENTVSQQMTLATLCKGGDDVWEVKTLQQKVLYQGFIYVVYDIYGIEQSLAEAAEECVICLTEPRDTVVIPCRHMCVCHQCAQVLRYQANKCPICRGAVRSMIKLKVSKDNNKTQSTRESSGEESDDHVLLKKSKKKKPSGTESDMVTVV